MSSKLKLHKVLIGRAMPLDFVDFNIKSVPAKVDTGAYKSAIHAGNIRQKDGRLFFSLFKNHPVCEQHAVETSTDDFKEVWISNSFGMRQKRYEVKLKVRMGPRVFKATFTLANRKKKIYPILLGRTFLNGRFLIDTSITRLDRVELKKKYGIAMPKDEEYLEDDA